MKIYAKSTDSRDDKSFICSLINKDIWVRVRFKDDPKVNADQYYIKLETASNDSVLLVSYIHAKRLDDLLSLRIRHIPFMDIKEGQLNRLLDNIEHPEQSYENIDNIEIVTPISIYPSNEIKDVIYEELA